MENERDLLISLFFDERFFINNFLWWNRGKLLGVNR